MNSIMLELSLLSWPGVQYEL